MTTCETAAIPGVKPALEYFEVYETLPKLYVIACDANKQTFRVLKFDRRSEEELLMSEDNTTYTSIQIRNLLDTLKAAFNGKAGGGGGGFRHQLSGYGILGVIRFTRCYHLVMITKRRLVAQLGPHLIYEIKETETISLSSSAAKLSARTFKDDETRYRDLFLSFDTKRDFYFSYTYDISHTLQFNCQRNALQQEQHPERSSTDTMFVYNSFLLRPLQTALEDCNSPWVLSCIHGFLSQMVFDVYGRKIHLVLIARRSRYFAGTRYLKRGISDEGNVANHIEVEQVAFDASLGLCGTVGQFSSFVQVRGSIPVYWYQPTKDQMVHRPRPPIKLGRSDPGYAATKLHYAQLFSSYGVPIISLDLLKQKEKNPRESILGAEYRQAILTLNSKLPEDCKIQHIQWDFRNASKEQETVNNEMTSIAEEVLSKTGIFTSSNTVREQIGTVRTNCVDCLDRTNLAQFFIGKCALSHQFAYLGVSNMGTHLVDHQLVYNLYLSHCIQMGDRIALQYGGSRAVSAGVPSLLNRWDVFTSLTRYYNNNFLDLEKQKSMNIFLGNYTPHVSVSDVPDDDTCVADVSHPMDAAVTFAFQRPAKFILSSHDVTCEGATSPLVIEGKANPASLSTSVSYTFPWNIRDKSMSRLDNASFGGSFEEISKSGSGVPRSVSGDNIHQNSPQLCPPSCPPGGGVDDRPEERRVIDLWDIENDHYLHLQDSNQKFLAPPVVLNTAKWWEIPLMMWAARRLTRPELSLLKYHQLSVCETNPPSLIKKMSSGVKLPRLMGNDDSKDIDIGSNVDTSSPTLSHVGSWGDSVKFQKSWKLLSPSPLQQSQSAAGEFHNFFPIRKEITREGDKALLAQYPTEFLTSFEQLQLSTLTADEDTCQLTDTPEPSDHLQLLRQQLEGKFSSEEPYLLPIRKLQGDQVNAARSLSQKLPLHGGRDHGGEKVDDIPIENYQLYREYHSAKEDFERQAYEDLSLPPWKNFLAEVKQSRYLKSKTEARAKESWLTNYNVKQLVCEADTLDANRLLDLQTEAMKLKQHEPKSLSKYETYVSMGNILNEAHDESTGHIHSSLTLQYSDYISRPCTIQEEMSVIESDALQYGTYFPEQDSGSILNKMNDVFSPFLETPIPVSCLEAHLRQLVKALRVGFVTEDRTRHVRGSNATTTHKLKNIQTETSSHIRVEVFENTFLARQAIDFVLSNIEELQLNKRFITHHPCPRKRVVDFLNLMLQSSIFHHVVQDDSLTSVSKFQDSFKIYRFMDDEKLRVLNVSKKPVLHACTPNEFSQILLKKALRVYRLFLDGSDNEALFLYIKSSKFTSLSDLACDLQALKLSDLVTDNQKIAFWVNIHNVLEIHAQFTIGGAFSVHQNVYFCTSAYNVGGYVVTLDVIQNGILRGNRRGPCHYSSGRLLTHNLFRPLAPGDPRKLLAVSELDVRIHFALLRLTSDDLPNFVVEDDGSTENSPASASRRDHHQRTVTENPSVPQRTPVGPPSKDFIRPKISKRSPDGSQYTDPNQEDCGSTDSGSGDEAAHEAKARPLSFFEVLLGASKKTVQKPPIDIVLDAATLDSALQDIISKSLQWGTQIIADQESNQLWLPSVFFVFREDFGDTDAEKVRHALRLLTGTTKRRLARFCQRPYTLRSLPKPGMGV
eukprot:TRINITY_DN8779_c0_g1_i1.p1 TRINITY_DN8779_c0_g1~~TRINITY_DN8779_c0_g1_i1.p1  ORF type:complete len:1644 (+),score=308.03 TRINITY_DN8779_c0_g1_i1:155-5086(+)